MRNELRYEMMAVLVNMVDECMPEEAERNELIKDMTNGHNTYGTFTEEERKFMLIVLNGINNEGLINMYGTGTDEDRKYLEEAITECIHMEYEGYSEGEKLVIKAFLQDVGYYIQESKKTGSNG